MSSIAHINNIIICQFVLCISLTFYKICTVGLNYIFISLLAVFETTCLFYSGSQSRFQFIMWNGGVKSRKFECFHAIDRGKGISLKVTCI